MTGCIIFAVSTHALTATANKVIIQTSGTGSGTVTISPKSGEFVNGKAVTLTAKPDKDSVFTFWNAGGSTPAVGYAPTLKVEAPCGGLDVTRQAFFRAKADCVNVVLTPIPATQSGMVGVSFYKAVTFNAAAGGVKFTAKGLPPGLKINANTGEITGAPTKVGNYIATVNAASLADAKTKSAEPITVTFDIAALPPNVAGTYNGCLTTGWVNNSIEGSPVTVTVSASGKVSAKIVTEPGKTVSFSAPSLERSGTAFSVSMENAKAFRGLAVYIDPTQPWNDWQMDGAVWGMSSDLCIASSTIGTFNAQRNAFLDKPMATAAQTVLDTHKGYYTMEIFPFGPSLSGAIGILPGGYGYLTATIGDRGSVKIAGKLADGTAVSTRSMLLPSSLPYADIPVYIPLYGKRGWIHLPIEKIGDFTVSGAGFWSYPGKSPTATADAFVSGVNAVGCLYDTDISTFQAGANFSVWEGVTKIIGNVPFVPDVKGGMTLPKARKPYLEKGADFYTYDPVNPFGATFSENKKTGIFTGKLTSFEETMVNGKPTLTGTTCSYQGVLMPGSGSLFYPSKVVYGGVTYTIKRSYRVEIHYD